MLNNQRLFLMVNQHLGALPMVYSGIPCLVAPLTDVAHRIAVGSGASSSRSWPQENVQASFRGTEGIFGKFFTADVGWHSGRRPRCFETKNRICGRPANLRIRSILYISTASLSNLYIYNYIMIWWVCLEVISPPKNLDGFRSFKSDKPPAICRSNRYTNFDTYGFPLNWTGHRAILEHVRGRDRDVLRPQNLRFFGNFWPFYHPNLPSHYSTFTIPFCFQSKLDHNFLQPRQPLRCNIKHILFSPAAPGAWSWR